MTYFTENTAYNKHLYNILHNCWNAEMLDEEALAIAIDIEIDTFDMAHDLFEKIEYKKNILA